MLSRLALILVLVFQPLAGLLVAPTNCGSGPRTAADSEDAADCGGCEAEAVPACCELVATHDEDACPCSQSVCPAALGHECSACECTPSRPVQPATNAPAESRIPFFASLFSLDLPPAPAPLAAAPAPTAITHPLSWLSRAATSGDRRSLLCSLTT